MLTGELRTASNFMEYIGDDENLSHIHAYGIFLRSPLCGTVFYF